MAIEEIPAGLVCEYSAEIQNNAAEANVSYQSDFFLYVSEKYKVRAGFGQR